MKNQVAMDINPFESTLRGNSEDSSMAHEQTIEETLKAGLDALDVSYGDNALEKLLQYLELLQEWNATHNLTAIDDIESMIRLHVFDCASIRPYVKGQTLLDVGSGAGLPGMILAILSPALEVTSVDSRNKKIQFQKYAANKLQLKNFTALATRIEDFQSKEKFANITSRAFASACDFVQLSKHLISPSGRWLAMKGVLHEDEIKDLKKLSYKHDNYALKVPNLEASRNLIVINAPK